MPGVSNAQSVLSKALGKCGDKAAKALIKNEALRTSLERIVGSALSEGSEGYVQEILDPILRNIFLKEDNEVKLFTPEAAYAGLLGSMSGGMFELPGAIRAGVEVKNGNAPHSISLEDFTNNDSPIWNNVDYNDKESQSRITKELHDRMVQNNEVVDVPETERVNEAHPDLTHLKKKERNVILRDKIKQLKTDLKTMLEGLGETPVEFNVNNNLIEARLYGTGIREVLKKLTKDKSNMLYQSKEIFKNSKYLYSTQDYDGNEGIYRWNYFYTPVKIGDDIVGVRIAVRDMKKAAESQLYNWDIKKEAPVEGTQGGLNLARELSHKEASSGSAEPNTSISNNTENINSLGAETVKRDMSNAYEQTNFREQIKRMMLGKMSPTEIIKVGTTPEILQRYGAKSHNITLKQSTVRKFVYPVGYMGGKHNLGFYFLDSIPEQLNNPVAILKSKTQADSLVVITEFLDTENNPVQIALHLDKQGNLGIANEMASAYGKRGFENFIELNRKEGNVLYENQEKGLDEFPGIGLQLPKLEAESTDPINSIDLKSDTVNREYIPENEKVIPKNEENIIDQPEATDDLTTTEEETAPPAEEEVQESAERAAMRRRALETVNRNSPDAQRIYREIMSNYGYGKVIQNMDAAAKKLGTKITYYAEDGRAEGYAEDGSIYLNVKNLRSTQEGVWRLFKHELSHTLQGATKAYGKLFSSKAGQELFNKFLKDNGYTNITELENEIRSRYSKNGKNLTEEELNYELMARFIEGSDILNSEESIRKLTEASPNLAQRIIEWFKDMRTRFKGTDYDKQLAQAERLYLKAVKEAKRNGAYSGGQETGRSYLFARNTDERAADTAERAERRGATEEDIWNTLGLKRDSRGNWIREIDDSGAEFDAKGLTKDRLSDVFKHDELYREYPEAENIRFEFADLKGKNALYDFKNKKIILDNRYKNGNNAEATSKIIHELQHYLQSTENRSAGGSRDMAYNYLMNRAYERYSTTEEFTRLKSYRQRVKYLENKIKEAYGSNNLERILFNEYRAIEGEEEARAAADRQDMNIYERADNYPKYGNKGIDWTLKENAKEMDTSKNYAKRLNPDIAKRIRDGIIKNKRGRLYDEGDVYESVGLSALQHGNEMGLSDVERAETDSNLLRRRELDNIQTAGETSGGRTQTLQNEHTTEVSAQDTGHQRGKLNRGNINNNEEQVGNDLFFNGENTEASRYSTEELLKDTSKALEARKQAESDYKAYEKAANKAKLTPKDRVFLDLLYKGTITEEDIPANSRSKIESVYPTYKACRDARQAIADSNKAAEVDGRSNKPHNKVKDTKKNITTRKSDWPATDVEWRIPGRKSPIAYSSKAASDLIGVLADEHPEATIKEIRALINYNNEAQRVLDRYISAGYGGVTASEYFSYDRHKVAKANDNSEKEASGDDGGLQTGGVRGGVRAGELGEVYDGEGIPVTKALGQESSGILDGVSAEHVPGDEGGRGADAGAEEAGRAAGGLRGRAGTERSGAGRGIGAGMGEGTRLPAGAGQPEDGRGRVGGDAGQGNEIPVPDGQLPAGGDNELRPVQDEAGVQSLGEADAGVVPDAGGGAAGIGAGGLPDNAEGRGVRAVPGRAGGRGDDGGLTPEEEGGNGQINTGGKSSTEGDGAGLPRGTGKRHTSGNDISDLQQVQQNDSEKHNLQSISERDSEGDINEEEGLQAVQQEIEQKTALAVPARNYRFPEGGLKLPSGEKSRYKANIAAIKLLKAIQAEGRQATPEEQSALALYVGWGSPLLPFT